MNPTNPRGRPAPSPPRDVLSRKVFYPGDVLLSEGAVATSAFLIESGRVEIFRTVGGNEIPLATIGDGALVGEMALIDDQPRMATARAKTQTVAIVLGRGVFEAKMADADPFIAKILKVFLRNIRTRTQEYAVARSKLDEFEHDAGADEGGDACAADDASTVTIGMIEVGEDVYARWSKDPAAQKKPNAVADLVCAIYRAMERERRVVG